MATIIPNQLFKHEGAVYEAGQSYEVSPELAFYFEKAGWVGGNPPATGQVHNLDVHDSVIGQETGVK